MDKSLTYKVLSGQPRDPAGTGGVSHENCEYGFRPAFLDRRTGRVYPSRRVDGSPACVHTVEGLPEDLAAGHDARGAINAVKDCVVPGFTRDGRFYSREEAAALFRQAARR